MVTWKDQLVVEKDRLKSEETKFPITELKKETRIITASGRVATLTGHKTKESVQIKYADDNQLDWLSYLARVHLAR